MSASRAWISPIRCASVATSASAISAARSVSASSTVSIRLSRVAGASCATPPIRARFGTSISPASSGSSPRISLKSVVLPDPFRPTNPTLCPAGIVAEASPKSFRPSIEKPMLRIASMMAPMWPGAPLLSTEPQAPLRSSYGLETWRAVVFPPTGGKTSKETMRASARSLPRQRPRPAAAAGASFPGEAPRWRTATSGGGGLDAPRRRAPGTFPSLGQRGPGSTDRVYSIGYPDRLASACRQRRANRPFPRPVAPW